jgi:hypothetical protein
LSFDGAAALADIKKLRRRRAGETALMLRLLR